MVETEKPWIEYTGQSSAELIALHQTHRIDSILCALEWAIQAKQEQQKLSSEETLFLSIMALDREVMNGGFDQFFTNSSSQYAPVIVENLRAIGSENTARLAERALENREDFDALDAIDQEYYANYENEAKLWAYIQRHAQAIDVPAMRS